jgi:hypothetical protein
MSDMFPFYNRPLLWDLYQPLIGGRMLELGDKLDSNVVYKPFFVKLGFEHVSIDLNGNNGALPLDLTQPLGLGTFDMVTNIGTSEHVSEEDWAGQVECWRNIVDALHVGSVLICDTPAPGGWRNHGRWYPHPKWYEELARLNGLEVERLGTHPWRPGHTGRKVVSARLRRTELVPFACPARKHMFENR